jgi:TonB family protein
MTLVEALTQRLPEWERTAAEAEPIVPDTLAEPFLQIARRCLRRNPALRLKAADISSRLEPLPVQELPAIAQAAETPARSHNLIWVVAIALLLAAIATTSVRLKRHHPARQATPHAIEKPKPQTNAKHVEQPAIKEPSAAASINRKFTEKTDLRAPLQPVAEKKIAIPEAVQEEAIHQVLPDVPQKAKDTIHGTVRVRVKVSVDPSGRVTEAALDFPGPSRYFADLALQAARQWTFGRASTTNPNTPRAWTLHFEFLPTETRARAEKAGV